MTEKEKLTATPDGQIDIAERLEMSACLVETDQRSDWETAAILYREAAQQITLQREIIGDYVADFRRLTKERDDALSALERRGPTDQLPVLTQAAIADLRTASDILCTNGWDSHAYSLDRIVRTFSTPASPPAQREDSQTPTKPEAKQSRSERLQSISERFPATMAHLAKSETPQGAVERESLEKWYDNRSANYGPPNIRDLCRELDRRKLDKGGV